MNLLFRGRSAAVTDVIVNRIVKKNRFLGDDALQLLNAERRQVLDLLRDDGALTPAQIAAELAKARPAVRMLLKRMREDGQVEKQGSKYGSEREFVKPLN